MSERLATNRLDASRWFRRSNSTLDDSSASRTACAFCISAWRRSNHLARARRFKTLPADRTVFLPKGRRFVRRFADSSYPYRAPRFVMYGQTSRPIATATRGTSSPLPPSYCRSSDARTALLPATGSGGGVHRFPGVFAPPPGGQAPKRDCPLMSASAPIGWRQGHN